MGRGWGFAQAVFAENWVVYHYWNVHAHRNEVSVLEVFDDDAARRTPPLLQAVALTALGLNRKSPVSSLAPPAVRVMGQSYFFSMGVKTMAVTSTQRGITSKNVLLGTSTDQVRGCVCVCVCGGEAAAMDLLSLRVCACLPCLWVSSLSIRWAEGAGWTTRPTWG